MLARSLLLDILVPKVRYFSTRRSLECLLARVCPAVWPSALRPRRLPQLCAHPLPPARAPCRRLAHAPDRCWPAAWARGGATAWRLGLHRVRSHRLRLSSQLLPVWRAARGPSGAGFALGDPPGHDDLLAARTLHAALWRLGLPLVQSSRLLVQGRLLPVPEAAPPHCRLPDAEQWQRRRSRRRTAACAAHR